MPFEASPNNPIEARLRAEIEASGPISFEHFMEVALYDPELGYYCRGPKPIGKSGDFYTASQLQPLFGSLMRRYLMRLSDDHHLDLPRTLTEFAAGHGEMAEAFADWSYLAKEVHSQWEDIPASGFLFANELFDALPVRAGLRHGGEWFEMLVDWNGSCFQWTLGPSASPELSKYAGKYGAPAEDGFQIEMHQRSIALLSQLLERSKNALMVFVDYGYTAREWRRFPAGTLMAYRKHRADADVLATPGSRDITAHVPFDVLRSVAEECGARVLRMERLSMALLFAGEEDQFESLLDGRSERESFALRQQLKTLLYSFGESFSVLAIAKGPN